VKPPRRNLRRNSRQWGNNIVPLAHKLPAPKHLEEPEAELWEAITENYSIDESAGLELLDTALQARCRMRKCREAINRDGEAVKDRWGQIRAHPLLVAERGARDSFLKAMRALNLDIAGND